jgi:hypothetical protein
VAYIGKNPYKRIVTMGYSHVLGPTVDSLSREPLFINAMKKELQGLDFAVQSGRMTSDEAHWVAAQRATIGILPQIHNPLLRSQFSILANNYLPFYFAQEQSYKRFGRLALSNPEMARRYQMIYAGMNNSAFVQTDASGGKHVMLPGAGPVGEAFINAAAAIGLPLTAGLPMSATGSTASLQSVMPETNLPGVSPILGLAMKYVAEHNPTLSKIVNNVDPYASNSDLLSTFMPSSPVRDAITGLTGDEKNLGFANAYTDALRAAYYHGDLQGYATMTVQQQQAALDRIKNNTKSMFIFKALLGTVSPLAPTVSEADPGLRQEFLNMVDAAYKKGPMVVNPDGSRESSYASVMHQFLAEHGTNAISYTVASTIPSDPGYIPLNNPAIQWVEKNLQHITGDKLGAAASFLVPQTSAGGDAQTIQDELMKDNLRSRATPSEFMDAVYTAAGNNYIAPDQAAHSAFVAAHQGDSLALNQEYNSWQAYQQHVGQANPIWWKHYNDQAAQQQLAIRTIAGLQTLLRDPNGWVNKSEPQVVLVTSMLNDWMLHEAQRTNLTGRAATNEAHAWEGYLRQRELDTPALAPLIRTVFVPLGSS